MSDSEIERIITGDTELNSEMMYQILFYLESGRLDLDKYGKNIITNVDKIKSSETIKENGVDTNIKYYLAFEVSKLLLSTIETNVLVYKDNVYVKIDEIKDEKKSEKESLKEKKYHIYVSMSNKTLLIATLTVSVSGIYYTFSLKKHMTFNIDENINIELFNKRFSFSFEIKKKYDPYVNIKFQL
jgi:hypothetical protein